jgi:hypothetical protein
MANHQADPLFLHPILHAALCGILAEIKEALPPGWRAGIDSQGVHRMPQEQFAIYRKGRRFDSSTGKWVTILGEKQFTPIDGFKSRSRHNFLGAQAVDIVLYRPDGSILKSGPEEQQIAKGADKFNLTWGGRFKRNQDMPHIEIPKERLFQKSFDRDEALQWQKYLFHAGALSSADELDGFFAQSSTAALEKVTGMHDRTPEAWEKLFTNLGPIENFAKEFAQFAFIPTLEV